MSILTGRPPLKKTVLGVFDFPEIILGVLKIKKNYGFFNNFSIGFEAEILTIQILENVSQNFFVFQPCWPSSYKPSSARDNISPLFAFRVCWDDHPHLLV